MPTFKSFLLLALLLPVKGFLFQHEIHSAKLLGAHRQFKGMPMRCFNVVLQEREGNDDREPEEKNLFVFDNMVVFDRINQALTATAWGFLLAGFLLNALGYDFIVRDGKLTVDTLEKRQFENEVMRVVRSDSKAENQKINGNQ